MNLREFLQKKGFQINVASLGVWQAVDVCFINSEGWEDETQFDIQQFGTKSGNEELIRLFTDFCKENKYPTNTVINAVVVASARTYEELQTHLC